MHLICATKPGQFVCIQFYLSFIEAYFIFRAEFYFIFRAEFYFIYLQKIHIFIFISRVDIDAFYSDSY